MLEQIRSWVLGITAAAVFCAAAMELCPRGPVKAVLRSLCALVLTVALLSPLLHFDYPSYSLHLAQYRSQAEAAVRRGQNAAAEMNRRVIEQRLCAYILDKAQQLGLSLREVRVTLKWSPEGLWYPVAVDLEGAYSAALSEYIAAEIGVGAAAQNWRNNEGT